MKKLKLSRETLSVLNASDLESIRGGAIITISPTLICPLVTANCPLVTALCPMTGGGGTVGSCTSECGGGGTTSIINPGGGF